MRSSNTFPWLVFCLALSLGVSGVLIYDRLLAKGGGRLHKARQAIRPVETPGSSYIITGTKRAGNGGNGGHSSGRGAGDTTASVSNSQPPVMRRRVPGLARIAIITDDFGYNLPLAVEFINFDVDLTIAVLPCSPHSRDIATKAAQRGKHVLLHMPMEPIGNQRASGMIKASMQQAEIERLLSAALESVPFAEGLNNHMGSKVTADPRAMRAVMQFARKHSLYFVDSITTPLSCASSTANRFNIPFARRELFLDNEENVEYVVRQLDALAAMAEMNGCAVGLCHAMRSTLEALKARVPALKQSGATFVAVRQLLNLPNSRVALRSRPGD